MKVLLICLAIACVGLGAVVLATMAQEGRPIPPRSTEVEPSRQPSAPTSEPLFESLVGSSKDADDDEESIAAFNEACKTIESVLNRAGEQREDVYIVTYPRDDLDVTMDGWDVPTGAGLESDFRFFHCPCGKMLVMGQFVVTDYETNDVVDALLQDHLIVSSVSPLLLYERPRLMLIRFQGEGQAAALAKTLKQALEWVGEARMAPQKKVGFGADADVEDEDCCGEE